MAVCVKGRAINSSGPEALRNSVDREFLQLTALHQQSTKEASDVLLQRWGRGQDAGQGGMLCRLGGDNEDLGKWVKASDSDIG